MRTKIRLMCGSLEKSEPRCFWPGRLRKKMDDGQTCTVRRTQSLRPCGLALGELGRTNLSGSTNYWFVHVCSGVYHGLCMYIYIEQGLAQNSYHIDVSNGKVQATCFINPWILLAPKAPLVYPMTVL